MAEENNCRPIPAPRRLHIDGQLNKVDYENVTVDIIDKNLNINVENLQNNANYCDKVPNKSFLLPNILEASTDKMNQQRLSSILTETNDFYASKINNSPSTLAMESNLNTEGGGNYSTVTKPAPVPRSRRQLNANNNLSTMMSGYENVEINPSPSPEHNDNKDEIPSTTPSIEKVPNSKSTNPFRTVSCQEQPEDDYNASQIEEPLTVRITASNSANSSPINAEECQESSFNENLANASEQSRYYLPSPGYVSRDEAVSNDGVIQAASFKLRHNNEECRSEDK